jgi:hypothetical protein
MNISVDQKIYLFLAIEIFTTFLMKGISQHEITQSSQELDKIYIFTNWKSLVI